MTRQTTITDVRTVDLYLKLEKEGINAVAIASNQLFQAAVIHLISGQKSVSDMVDLAKKIDILTGGRYSKSSNLP